MAETNFDIIFLEQQLDAIQTYEADGFLFFAQSVVRFVKTEAKGNKEGDELLVGQLSGDVPEIVTKRIEALKLAFDVNPGNCVPIPAGTGGWGENGAVAALSFATNVPGLTMEYRLPPIKTQPGMQDVGGMQEVVLVRQKTS